MKTKYYIGYAFCLSLVTHCSSDSKTTQATASEEEGVFAIAIPTSIVLPTFGASSTALTEGTEENELASEKIQKNKDRSKGIGECFDPNEHKKRDAEAITCYEFDWMMNLARRSGQADYGTIDGTHTDGEACLVAFARQEMVSIEEMIKRGVGTSMTLACQAAKAGSALPVAGETLDLTSVLAAAVLGKLRAPTINEATIALDEDGTFTTTIDTTDSDSRSLRIVLINTPVDGLNSGSLSIVRGRDAGVSTGDFANKNSVLSIHFAEQGDADSKDVVAELLHAGIHQDYDAVDADNRVNFAALPTEASNSVVNAIKYVSFAMNTATNIGTLSYWMNPGGSVNESARGFLFAIEEGDAEQPLKGCAVTGATQNISVRKHLSDASQVLKPVRYWMPFFNQNTHPDKDARYSASEGPFVTQQCFALTAGETKYTVDAENTESDRGYDLVAQAESTMLPPKKPDDVE